MLSAILREKIQVSLDISLVSLAKNDRTRMIDSERIPYSGLKRLENE